MDFIHYGPEDRQQKMSTLISIIVPVYKVQLDYLRICLDSLINQTMKESEFIIVSDGAPKAECSVCEEFAKKDSRFKFYKRTHVGVSATRNFGIDVAQGDYLTFVDCDDWIAKDTCSKVYAIAKENNSDFAFWDLNFFHNNKISSKTSFSKANLATLNNEELNLFKQCIIHAYTKELLVPALTPCKIIRSSLIKKIGLKYNEDINYGEDRVFNFTLMKNSLRISYLCESLYFYRIHAQSATQKYQENYLGNAIKYISQLDKLSCNSFNKELGNEFWEAYSISWQRYYMNSENPLSFSKRMANLVSLLKQSFCSKKIQDATYENLNIISSIELFLVKRKIYAIIWIHGLAKGLIEAIHPCFPK